MWLCGVVWCGWVIDYESILPPLQDCVKAGGFPFFKLGFADSGNFMRVERKTRNFPPYIHIARNCLAIVDVITGGSFPVSILIPQCFVTSRVHLCPLRDDDMLPIIHVQAGGVV